MRRILSLVSLFLLPQAAIGFLPAAPAASPLRQRLQQQQQQPQWPQRAPALQPLGSSLFGADGLLVGGAGAGKGKGKGSDPAPGDFDLLGAKADASVPALEQVGGFCIHRIALNASVSFEGHAAG